MLAFVFSFGHGNKEFNSCSARDLITLVRIQNEGQNRRTSNLNLRLHLLIPP